MNKISWQKFKKQRHLWKTPQWLGNKHKLQFKDFIEKQAFFNHNICEKAVRKYVR